MQRYESFRGKSVPAARKDVQCAAAGISVSGRRGAACGTYSPGRQAAGSCGTGASETVGPQPAEGARSDSELRASVPGGCGPRGSKSRRHRSPPAPGIPLTHPGHPIVKAVPKSRGLHRTHPMKRLRAGFFRILPEAIARACGAVVRPGAARQPTMRLVSVSGKTIHGRNVLACSKSMRA